MRRSTVMLVAMLAAELPTVSIRDAAVTEQRDSAVFAVMLSEPSAEPVTVDFATADGTATSRPDAVFSNTDPIVIPEAGNAVPYPHTVYVHDVSWVVQKVTVTLHGFTHTSTSDVDILLVAPGGQRIALMSDVGGGSAANGLDLTFADDAPALPEGPFGSGTYRPTDVWEGYDVWGAPAPSDVSGSRMSVFNSPPNGEWQLYVVDDRASGSGTISGGWSLHIMDSRSDYTSMSGTLTFPPGSVIQGIEVPITWDSVFEPDETFSVNLSNAASATIVDGQAVGTIIDGSQTYLRLFHVHGAYNEKFVWVMWNMSAREGRVYRSNDGSTFAHIGTVTQHDPWGYYVFKDYAVEWDTSYLYKVRSVEGGVETAETDMALATVAWQTDILNRRIELLPFQEIFLRVNAVRRLAGLPPMTFSGEPPAVGGLVRAQHLIDLRAGVDEARLRLGIPRWHYHDPRVTAGSTPIRYVHVGEFWSATNCGSASVFWRYPCTSVPQ